MEYGSRSHAEHNIVWIGIIACVGLLVMFIAYTFLPSASASMSVSVGAKTFQAHIADTEDERVTGLASFETLAEDQALLVPYEYDAVWTVQTKGLNFPIDIVWVTANKRVAYVAKDAQPSATATYKPGGKSRYVLQLPAGSVVKYGITAGKPVNFEYGE